MNRAPVLAALAVAAVLAGCGSSSLSDGQVAQDLASLLSSKSNLTLFIQPSQIICAHQNANQYTCAFPYQGRQINVNVTDDGHTIAETGFAP